MDEQVEVAWEPEPLFDTGRGLSDREVDAIEDRLVVIRTWIKYMGLGELEVLSFACICRIPAFLNGMRLRSVVILACAAHWAMAMALTPGDSQAATKALYESWERDGRFAGIATEGVSRAQWVRVCRLRWRVHAPLLSHACSPRRHPPSLPVHGAVTLVDWD